MEPIPAEHRLRWILTSVARLHDAGAEPVSGLVLPNAEYFPDVFDRSRKSVELLLRRMLKHAGLSDVPVELAVGGAEPADAGSCSSGACATPAIAAPLRRVERVDEGYRVGVLAAEVGHPTALSSALVRAVAAIFLLEADVEVPPGEREETIDVAGVLLGFGVLLCNGAYIYQKSCGGVRVASVTRLPVEELSLALAIFCKLHAVSARAAASELDPTARTCFAEARRWADSNAEAVALAGSDPLAIEAGSYTLREARGWLSRALGMGRTKSASAPTAEELDRLAKELPRQRPGKEQGERDRRLAELRELVDEALES